MCNFLMNLATWMVDGNIGLRIRYARQLMAKGYSRDEAQEKAFELVEKGMSPSDLE